MARYEWIKHTSWFLKDNSINHMIASISRLRRENVYSSHINLYGEDGKISLNAEVFYPDYMTLDEIKADVEEAVCE